MPTPLILAGAGGLAREVLSALETQSTYQVHGLVDDDPGLVGQLMGGVPVIGPLSNVVDHPQAMVLICVGRGPTRALIRRRLLDLGVGEQRFATVIDSSVRVAQSVEIGVGTIILAGTVLTADVRVGRHVVLMPNATLTHDDVVMDYATVCAGAAIGGSVRVGRAAYLGMNCSVRERVTIGEHAVLGMGAALVEDLPAHETWAGVPARRLRKTLPTSLRNFEIESATA